MEWQQRTAMRTHTGQPIVYGDPSQTEVRWEDLIVALSRQRRYCGFLDWSILHHLALCGGLATGRSLSPRLVALCAAHDLHEAYILDIPKGLKECLPGYAPIEAAWERHVHEALGLGLPTSEEHEWVKAIDRRALGIEMAMLGWKGWAPGDAVFAIDGEMTEAETAAWDLAQICDVSLTARTVRRAIETVTC